MGATSTLLTFDMVALHERVLPGLRDWIIDGVVVDWWREALLANGITRVDPIHYELAPFVEGCDSWMDIFDPVDGLAPALDDWYTSIAFEIAVVSAAAGDGLMLGRSVPLDFLLDHELWGPQPILTPPAEPGDELTALVERLEDGLSHLRKGGGGWGEGLRGMLDAAQTAALDDALSAHGSRPVDGTMSEIGAAFCALDNARYRARRDASLLLALHSMARRARRDGQGLLLGRDLDDMHLGTWEHGVLHRHPGAPPPSPRIRW